MPTRKKASARKHAPRRRAPARRAKKSPHSSNGILVFLLLVSLCCLTVSIYMLIQEKQKGAGLAQIDQKAQELARQHPDAEVFNLTEPAVKKK